MMRHRSPRGTVFRLVSIIASLLEIDFFVDAYPFVPKQKNYDSMRVTSLHRYAVKGLSGDSVQSVIFEDGDGAFPDDRRFSLLFETNIDKFDPKDPKWLHKENFLCAFTAPELLASLDTEYKILREGKSEDTKRLLTVWKRGLGRSSPPLVGPLDLSSKLGREKVAAFFSELCGKKVRCVVSGSELANTNGISNKHIHQFGNTSSGVKNNNGDTRTIHIVNLNTVMDFSAAVYSDNLINEMTTEHNPENILSATRFRPNIVIDNLDPWAEFDLIGKTIEVVPNAMNHPDVANQRKNCSPLRFRIVSRTVRCAGVGVDPLRPDLGTIDIPALLAEKFPEHGPYLGVYAVVDGPTSGVLCVGDRFRVVENS